MTQGWINACTQEAYLAIVNDRMLYEQAKEKLRAARTLNSDPDAVHWNYTHEIKDWLKNELLCYLGPRVHGADWQSQLLHLVVENNMIVSGQVAYYLIEQIDEEAQ